MNMFSLQLVEKWCCWNILMLIYLEYIFSLRLAGWRWWCWKPETYPKWTSLASQVGFLCTFHFLLDWHQFVNITGLPGLILHYLFGWHQFANIVGCSSLTIYKLSGLAIFGFCKKNVTLHHFANVTRVWICVSLQFSPAAKPNLGWNVYEGG